MTDQLIPPLAVERNGAGRRAPAEPAPVAAPSSGLDPIFRPEIQGLRGIAVLLVVLYHAGLSFSGGYIGVDVFFVISGFVIVRSLHDELKATDRVDFRRFYTRRARRLLPAFAVTSVLTLAGTALLLDSIGEQQRAVRTGIAASLFAANLALSSGDNDYFGPAQDSNPFLHTWSLSLEEQFYFVLPVSLFVLWRLGMRLPRSRPDRSPAAFVAVCVAAVGLVSLAASVVLTSTSIQIGSASAKSLAFYAMPLRWWEFAAGVLLALAPRSFGFRSSRVATGVAVVAAFGLVAAAVGYRDATTFPGLTALAPVLATAALIFAGPTSFMARRFLSLRPLVLIGDVSYGWYLLHWPAIVFANRLWPGQQTSGAAAAVVSLALALALYPLVEQPIRHNRSIVGWRVLTMAAVSIAVPVVAAGAVGYMAVSGRGADVPAGRDDSALPVARSQQCIIESVTSGGSWDRSSCLFNPEGTGGTVLLVGDSHAASFSDAVVEAGRELGRPVAVWARASCPFVGRAAPGYQPCLTWQDDAMKLVDELDPEIVVIANRSPAYVWPTVGSESPLGPISQPDGSPSATRAEALDSWESGLRETVQALSERGIEVVVVATVPEYPPGAFTNASILRPHPEPPVITLDEVAERRGDVLEREQRAIADLDRVVLFDPAAALCDAATSRCRAAEGEQWLYTDNHHINRFGGARLAPKLADALQSPTLSS